MANIGLEVVEFILKHGRPAAVKKFGVELINKIEQIKDNQALTSLFDRLGKTPAGASRRINKGIREGKITADFGDDLKEAHEARRYNQAEAAREAAEEAKSVRQANVFENIRKTNKRVPNKNKPPFAKGGMYKGKSHTYVAGGRVTDSRIIKRKNK